MLELKRSKKGALETSVSDQSLGKLRQFFLKRIESEKLCKKQGFKKFIPGVTKVEVGNFTEIFKN